MKPYGDCSGSEGRGEARSWTVRCRCEEPHLLTGSTVGERGRGCVGIKYACLFVSCWFELDPELG